MEKKRDYLLPLSVILAGLIIAGAVIYSNGLKVAKEKTSATPAEQKLNLKELDLQADDPLLGEKEAPLTMFIFSDYQCPFCARFHKLTYPEIVKNYVETKKLKIVFRDLPFHRYSLESAKAAWCAKDQGRFWEMANLLFEHFEKNNTLTKENLISFAKNLALNSLEFSNCLDSGKYLERINQSAKEAQNLGIHGTPTIIIAKKLPLKIDPEKIQLGLQQGNSTISLEEGTMIIGAQATPIFKEAIEKLLQQL